MKHATKQTYCDRCGSPHGSFRVDQTCEKCWLEELEEVDAIRADADAWADFGPGQDGWA